MKKLINDLYARYRAHRAMYGAVLEWIGVLGIAAFPLLHLTGFTGKLNSRNHGFVGFDGFYWQLAALALCVCLALRLWWPRSMRRHHFAVSYAAIFCSLAFGLALVMLQDKGAATSAVHVTIGAMLVILLVGWLNALFVLVCGHAAALAVYWLASAAPEWPLDLMSWWAPLCAVLFVGAGLSLLAERRREIERMGRHVRLYSSFAGSIARELRNPLIRIRHVLDAMAADLPGAYHPDGSVSLTHPQVGDMLRAVGQGQDAVLRGLQAITVTLQQLNPNTFDAATFRYLSASQYAKRAVNEFAYEDSTHRARVAVNDLKDFNFRGDEAAFALVLFNLIKNALYYLPTHPHLTVTVAVGAEDANRIVVRDTGPGIPHDRLVNMFDEFSGAARAEGAGLGLAYCRRAMRAMGGDIACRSKPGEGTEFILSFPPVAQAHIEADEKEALARAARALSGKRVLVVDDEALVRQSISARLATLGCHVDGAADGREALEALRQRPYELVLMDLHMPVSNGFEATREIRKGAAAGRERTPIVGFSGSPTSAAATRTRQAGMNGFVGKDCSIIELTQAITDALRGAVPRLGEPATTTLVAKTVLVVEDNAFNRASVKAHLVEWGMQVIEAAHGREALRLLDAGARPAVILMDVEMPGLDGLAATRVLRSSMPTPIRNTPVVALTGHASLERRDAARGAGMNGFLTKPLDPSALRRELIRVLGGLAADGGPASPVALPVALPVAVVATAAAMSITTMLDTDRINEFQRMGILHELLPGSLGEIRRFMARLEDCLACKDRNGAHGALHSLLGMSGEAGAQALRQAVEQVYDAINEGEWPREADWLGQIKRLVTATEKAMLDHYAVRYDPATP